MQYYVSTVFIKVKPNNFPHIGTIFFLTVIFVAFGFIVLSDFNSLFKFFGQLIIWLFADRKHLVNSFKNNKAFFAGINSNKLTMKFLFYCFFIIS